MKRTLTINLNNSIFNIDEDAYNELQNYLTSLKNHFSKEDGGDEILSDIEARIAEIFKEKISEFKQVIVIEDVNAIIETLGRPETIIDEDEANENQESESKSRNTTSKKKRIYRDTDNRVIGGVCSGLAAYFDIDPVFVRVVMALTFLFSGPLIYILLWVAIPAATTTAQKLEMKGEKINVSNIEKSIREELHEVKDNFKNMKGSKGVEKSRDAIMQIFDALFMLIKLIFKFVIGVIGIAFIIVGIVLLFVFSGAFVFDGWGLVNVSIPEVLNVFADQSSVTMGSIGFFLLVGIPVISIIYGGIKMLFNIKSPNKTIGVTLFIFWILGLIMFIATMVYESTNFRYYEKSSEKTELTDIKSDTLYVKLNNLHSIDENEFIISSNEFNLINDDDKIYIKGMPTLKIKQGSSDKFEMIVIKKAHGKNDNIAIKNTSNVEYNWTTNDSTLVLDNYFSLKPDKKWRDNQITIILNIPEGKTMFVDNNVRSLLSYSHYDDDNHIYFEDFLDEYYLMSYSLFDNDDKNNFNKRLNKYEY